MLQVLSHQNLSHSFLFDIWFSQPCFLVVAFGIHTPLSFLCLVILAILLRSFLERQGHFFLLPHTYSILLIMTCSSLLVFSAHFNPNPKPQLFVSILCLVLCPLSSSVFYLFWKSNLFWDTTKVVILKYYIWLGHANKSLFRGYSL